MLTTANSIGQSALINPESFSLGVTIYVKMCIMEREMEMEINYISVLFTLAKQQHNKLSMVTLEQQ